MKRLLLVDDDEMVLSGLAAVLETEGYRVETAPSGRVALELMAVQSFDLVLTDLVMEDTDGLTLLRQIAGQWPDLPVIVLTGHGTAASAMEAVRNGAADFIQKPAKSDEIANRIAGVLAGIEMRHKLEGERESARERQVRVDARTARRTRMSSLQRMTDGLAAHLDRMLEPVITASQPEARHQAMERLVENVHSLREKLAPRAADPNHLPPFIRLDEQTRQFIESERFQRIRESAPSVRFELKLVSGLPPFRMDPAHWETVLALLTPGAFTSSSPRGRVLFITGMADMEKPFGYCMEGPAGRYQFFRIQHSGYIPSGDLEHLFEPYYALQNLGREAAGAFGFTQALNLVHLGNGVLDLRSEQRLGTELTIYLPASVDVESIGPTADSNGAMGTALVVDDQESSRIRAAAILQAMNYEVESAGNISDAVEICASRHENGQPRFRVALIDLLLGEISDGVDLGLRLREIEPDLPIVLMSGFADSERLGEARKNGLIVQIQKPPTADSLAKAIQSALAQD
ncbi:MAG: response regulator [Kiritimatiellae bacterium]|nr:response regulator [Kiritimatiellia bacterium]